MATLSVQALTLYRSECRHGCALLLHYVNYVEREKSRQPCVVPFLILTFKYALTVTKKGDLVL